MRILQVAPPWFAVPPEGYGGIEAVVANLTDGLVAAGHEVTLLAAGGSRTTAHLCTVHPSPPSEALGDLVAEALHHLAVDELGPFDVVHDHTLFGTIRLVAAGTRHLVHTLHGPWTPHVRGIYERIGDRVSLVAISRHQAAAAGRVRVAVTIPHGIDTMRFPMSLHRTDELVFVGRATPDKGPVTAVEVARRTGRPLAMAIKVNEPQERAYWRDVVLPLLKGVDANVVVNATHEDAVAMMARSYAVLVPIDWEEPFGLVMLEAAACGGRVVAFDRGAAGEIVVDGRTGLLVDPGEGVEGMCRAVDAAGTIFPGACREHAEQHYGVDAMVQAHLELYERVTVPRFRRGRPAAFAHPFV